jgi:uncharacterized pyridoxamine 5'-phosphate oxidase family protein
MRMLGQDVENERGVVMLENKDVFGPGDKVHVISKNAVGIFPKVCEAKNVDGDKRHVCLVKIKGNEEVVDVYDIELLEKSKPMPKSILATPRTSKYIMARRGWKADQW